MTLVLEIRLLLFMRGYVLSAGIDELLALGQINYPFKFWLLTLPGLDNCLVLLGVTQ